MLRGDAEVFEGDCTPSSRRLADGDHEAAPAVQLEDGDEGRRGGARRRTTRGGRVGVGFARRRGAHDGDDVGRSVVRVVVAEVVVVAPRRDAVAVAGVTLAQRAIARLEELATRVGVGAGGSRSAIATRRTRARGCRAPQRVRARARAGRRAPREAGGRARAAGNALGDRRGERGHAPEQKRRGGARGGDPDGREEHRRGGPERGKSRPPLESDSRPAAGPRGWRVGAKRVRGRCGQ